MRLVILLIAFVFLSLCLLTEGRPNPVPDDGVDIMAKYEDDHKHSKDYNRVKRHRRYRSEDPEDLEVVDELPDFFHNIRRRNLDHYHNRPNIFKEIIESKKHENLEEDDENSG